MHYTPQAGLISCDCHRLRPRADLTSLHHSVCHLTARCTGTSEQHITVHGYFLQRYKAHLILGYLGSLWCLRVLGLWKTTLNLGFLCFFHVLFFTCFAAF